ncbi:MAG: hypothetical protein GY756_27765 [bacterium]|nr:hypothetical protein [bacterium]
MKNIILKLIIIIGLPNSFAFSQQQLNNNYLNEELPGSTAKLFGKDIISTKEYEHGSPGFSPSYKEIYWGVRMNQKPGNEIIKYVCKEGNGWSEPKIASFSCMGNSDLYPAFSYDGKEIYFTSGRSDTSNPDINNRCIWKVKKNGNDWSKPEVVGFDSLDIYGLSISKKATLFFMAQTFKDRGTMFYNIYYSKLKNGEYITPKKLDYPISTESFEDGPFIFGDEKFLLFESSKPGGYGENDIYISIKTEDGAWSKPKNLGKHVNT